MPIYKLTIEYDGTAYAGWQRQPNQPTVQLALEEALFQITQTPTHAVASGRTDAGVHAIGQVVSFQSDKILPPQQWTHSLNGVLPKDICIHHTEQMDDAFHARYRAKQKTYEYRIHNDPIRPVLNRLRMWHIPKPLHLGSIKEATTYLEGQHNFSSFEGSPTDNQNPLCHLKTVKVHDETPLIRITFQANRFLKQMIRALVGTLVEVGHGKRSSHDMHTILEAQDRRAAGKTAPPHGLYLLYVNYGKEDEKEENVAL